MVPATELCCTCGGGGGRDDERLVRSPELTWNDVSSGRRRTGAGRQAVSGCCCWKWVLRGDSSETRGEASRAVVADEALILLSRARDTTRERRGGGGGSV